jgi:hypothetical protein
VSEVSVPTPVGTAPSQWAIQNLIAAYAELVDDGDFARSYFTVLQALPDLALQTIANGRYHDRFERCDGQWRFAARRATVELVGDVSRHLRHAR